MKILHLIRHAKSSRGNSSLRDIDRPLNDRGKESCRIMAEHIVEKGCDFENVFCSPAKRALQTIECIRQSLPDEKFEWNTEAELYTFSLRELKRWIRRLDDSLEDVVVVGHNNAFTDLCNEIGDRQIDHLPTCGYAQFSFSGDSWSGLTSGTAKLQAFLTPEMFR